MVSCSVVWRSVAWCGLWCGVAWRGVWCGVAWRGVACGVVWCGVFGDQLIGPYIFSQRLTRGIYANVLQDQLPVLLDSIPLQTRRQMSYQHDGAPHHFSQVVKQHQQHCSASKGYKFCGHTSQIMHPSRQRTFNSNDAIPLCACN